MVDAFRWTIQRLKLDPTALGEPLYRLPALRMLVYTVVVRPIAVDFGVCTDRPMVFIKDIKLLTA